MLARAFIYPNRRVHQYQQHVQSSRLLPSIFFFFLKTSINVNRFFLMLHTHTWRLFIQHLYFLNKTKQKRVHGFLDFILSWSQTWKTRNAKKRPINCDCFFHPLLFSCGTSFIHLPVSIPPPIDKETRDYMCTTIACFFCCFHLLSDWCPCPTSNFLFFFLFSSLSQDQKSTT